MKFFLALSCFLPLYFIFGLKNVLKIIDINHSITTADEDSLAILNSNLNYNWILLAIWAIFIILSIIGIIKFCKCFLKSSKNAKRPIKIITAHNITAEYYFTYFSLFVLSFFTVTPTNFENIWDMIVLGVLLVLMIIVYLRNDMFFINPILNIMGYRSYAITYQRANSLPQDSLLFEAKVYSMEKLERKIDQECFIQLSQYDFSVCLEKKLKE